MIRLAPALRLQFVAWPSAMSWPWFVLAAAFAVNLGIFAAIDESAASENTTGGLSSVYICIAVLYIMTMTQMFPFALGMSLTRRALYAAMSAIAVAQALVTGLILYLLQQVEAATNGWGLDLAFFGLPFLLVDNPLLQILVYAGPFLALSFMGAVIGVIFKRWGPNGIWALGLGGFVVVGGMVIVMTWQNWWIGFGQWFADQSPVTLFVGYGSLLAAVLAATGYLMLRRATP